MAEKNNKNKRKFAAVLLGIVGVAGLSVASASTLTVNPDKEVAIGTSLNAFAPCDADGTVGVTYSYESTNYTLTDITLTGLDSACANKKATVEIAYTDVSASGAAAILKVSKASLTVDGSGNAVIGTPAPAVQVADDLGKVTVVIG